MHARSYLNERFWLDRNLYLHHSKKTFFFSLCAHYAAGARTSFRTCNQFAVLIDVRTTSRLASARARGSIRDIVHMHDRSIYLI
jgi:hypothetical protein